MARSTSLAKARETFERVARVGGNAIGYDVVRKHFYSPLPDPSELPESLWDKAHPTPGLTIDVDAAIALLEGPLLPFLKEWTPPMDATGVPGEFFVRNISYGSVDAEILYAMVRHRKPKRVIELGSGASSHVIDLARRRSESENAGFEHTIYDPFPFEANPMGSVETATLHKRFAQQISPSELQVLEAGDILFVDTTHTVKTGGDCNSIFLELVPALNPGVLVHVHDIFLPFEYPKHWVVDYRRAWAEQYLLQAFLAFNTSFEVRFPSYAVAKAAPERLRKAVPSFAKGEFRPGSFWFERVA